VSTNSNQLPRADAEEKYLLACLMDWPERAGEILSLCKPTDFFHPLHQQLWRKFKTQLAMRGAIDRLAVGKDLGCAEFLLELTDGAPTTTWADGQAEAVKLAARGRQVHEILTKGAQAIERGRPADAVLSQVQLALEPFEVEAIGA
jgi:replicative DNA helicase